MIASAHPIVVGTRPIRQAPVSGGTRAWQVDADTHAVLRSVALPDGVRAMAVDPYDHSLWVLSETRLVQFSADGGVMLDTTLATHLDPDETAYRPVLNPYGGNLWVGAGKMLLRLDPKGTPDIVTRLPDGIRQLAMGLDETLWVLTGKELLSLAPQGGITRRSPWAACRFARD